MIGADDVLSINVWKEPEVSRTVPVRSDGKISVPLAGELQASGETPAAFARRHGLHEVRVQRWVARVGRKARSAAPVRPVAFAPVRVTSAQPAVSALEVVVGGAVVRVGRGFDGDLLRRVVAVLGEASC